MKKIKKGKCDDCGNMVDERSIDYGLCPDCIMKVINEGKSDSKKLVL